MHAVVHLFRLGYHGLELSIARWPGLAPVALIALGMALTLARGYPEPVRGKWIWLCLPFLMPVLIVLYGVACQYDGPAGTAPAWQGELVDVMVWAHVPIALALAAYVRKNPLVPIGMSGFQMWLSFSVGLTSPISGCSRKITQAARFGVIDVTPGRTADCDS